MLLLHVEQGFASAISDDLLDLVRDRFERGVRAAVPRAVPGPPERHENPHAAHVRLGVSRLTAGCVTVRAHQTSALPVTQSATSGASDESADLSDADARLVVDHAAGAKRSAPPTRRRGASSAGRCNARSSTTRRALAIQSSTWCRVHSGA